VFHWLPLSSFDDALYSLLRVVGKSGIFGMALTGKLNQESLSRTLGRWPSRLMAVAVFILWSIRLARGAAIRACRCQRSEKKTRRAAVADDFGLGGVIC